MTRPSTTTTVGALALALAALAAIGATATAQEWREGRRTRDPRASDVRCLSAGGVLPAGLYATPGRYELRLPRCARPRFVLVTEMTPDAARATQALRDLAPVVARLAPGYPWIVNASEIGVAGDGILVVVGQFATEPDATAYRSALGLSAGARVLPIGEPRRTGADEDPPRVTQILASAPVRAYSTADVAQAESAFDEAFEQRRSHSASLRAYSTERAARLARATPRCSVAPGDVFVVPLVETRDAVFPMNAEWTWRPVRCGREVAWVPLRSTNAFAVVWAHRDGHARITQVSLVECDTPTHTTWTLAPNGDRSAPQYAPPGGC